MPDEIIPPVEEQQIESPIETPQAQPDWEAIGRGLAAHIPAAPAPAPQLSEEEIRKQLNMYRPTQADVDDLMEGGEKALATFERVLAAKAKEAVTVSEARTNYALQQLRAEFAPVIAESQKRLSEDFKNTMIKEHKDLAPIKDALPALVNAAIQQGFQAPQNPVEARKQLASAIRAMGIVPAAPASKPVPANQPRGAAGAPAGQTKTPAASTGNSFLDKFKELQQI